MNVAHLGNHELANHRFPDRIQCHRAEFPETVILERSVEDVAAVGFPTQASLRILRQVCRWGGYYGIAARVQRDNSSEQIAAAFRAAYGAATQGKATFALEAINELRGLGRPSFASKLLRFMAPQKAAILDSVISTRTGFPLTVEGYGELIQGCQQAAEQLVDGLVINPCRPSGDWYIADIEAAFYADMENFHA